MYNSREGLDVLKIYIQGFTVWPEILEGAIFAVFAVDWRSTKIKSAK